MKNIKMWANSEDQVKSILNYFAACGYTVKEDYYELFKDSRAFFAYTSGCVMRYQMEEGDDWHYFNKHENKEVFFATPVHEYVEVPEVDYVKPPLGLRPRHFPQSERTVEICEAIIRYAQAYTEVPKEWLDELYELNVKMDW